MRVALAVLLLALPALAGCFAAPGATPATGGTTPAAYDALEAEIGAPIVADHDHGDPKLHQHAKGLELAALVNGHEPASSAPQGEFYAETAVKGGYAYLTRYGPESGLVIFDVKDVEHPKLVSSLRLDEGFEPDFEVSDDGNWGFWETQRFPIAQTTPALDPIANLPHGVHIVDLHDKAHPKDAGFYPVAPDGPHSITYANVNGRNLLLLSVYAFAYAYENVEVPNAQRLEITELDASGPVPTLKKLAEYREPGATGGPGLFPHDVSVQKHPITGQWLAYVAYWDVGLVILDLTDPAAPKEVSKTRDFGPAKYGEVHMARGFPELIDGKHVTVVEPEHDGSVQPDTGYMTFLDTTDPKHPAYLSSWILPGNLTASGLRFSPHYFDVADGRVALASYHAGVWIIDVHDHENLMHPRTTGFAEMSSTRSGAGLGPFSFEEGAFDAWWQDGHVIAGDALNGLAVYRYTGPADAVR